LTGSKALEKPIARGCGTNVSAPPVANGIHPAHEGKGKGMNGQDVVDPFQTIPLVSEVGEHTEPKSMAVKKGMTDEEL
jgi:hypothetical protein